MVNVLKGDSLFMSTIDEITDVFGASVGFYVPFVDQIWPNVLSTTYKFEDVTSFESNVRSGKYSIAKTNEVYWRELLFRTHISVSASLIRTCRLMDATVREYHASNVPGTASCARAMLEGVADSIEALIHVPLVLAQRRDLVNQCLSGSCNDQLYGCEGLEEAMIHFTHARRLRAKKKGRCRVPTKRRPPRNIWDFCNGPKFPGRKSCTANFANFRTRRPVRSCTCFPRWVKEPSGYRQETTSSNWMI